MASNRTPATSMRLDPELKAGAPKVFDRMHVTKAGAVGLLPSEAVRARGMPLPLQEAHIEDEGGAADGR